MSTLLCVMDSQNIHICRISASREIFNFLIFTWSQITDEICYLHLVSASVRVFLTFIFFPRRSIFLSNISYYFVRWFVYKISDLITSQRFYYFLFDCPLLEVLICFISFSFYLLVFYFIGFPVTKIFFLFFLYVVCDKVHYWNGECFCN